MSEEKALVPIEERKVDFYGDEVIATLVEVNGQMRVYVPLRPICDYLGLSWSGQRERVNRDLVLSKRVEFVRVTRTNSPSRGNPNLFCLPLEFLNGWLFGVNPSRVKSEHRDRVVLYQEECYLVLSEAFQAESLAVVEASPSVTTRELEQIRDMGLAIARMAEQQLEAEQRLNARLDRAAVVVGDIQRRLGVVERKFHPAALISDEQAEEISAAVKALAELMTSKNPQKNFYQGIFGELYRRFGVSSYKNVRLEQYERVLWFLEDWRKAVESGMAESS